MGQRIDGYWDRGDTEIDLVAVNDDERTIRFGTIKRNPARLMDSVETLSGHIGRFLGAHRQYRDWRIERAAIAPRIDRNLRALLEDRGAIPQDLTDLIHGL